MTHGLPATQGTFASTSAASGESDTLRAPVYESVSRTSRAARAAPLGDLQAVERSAVHRQGARHHGPLSDPPDRALVLCVDEKSQIQALDRSQSMLPMRLGQAERRTHDYKRHGTTTLLAALDVATGGVIGSWMRRHRAREFRAFLDEVERNVPADLDIHVVMDNVPSHKTRLIYNWFAKRPLWHSHFTPTSSSWLNQVERFFALLTERKIKRGAHRSTADLVAAIERFCQRTLSVQEKVEYKLLNQDTRSRASHRRSPACGQSPSRRRGSRGRGCHRRVPRARQAGRAACAP